MYEVYENSLRLIAQWLYADAIDLEEEIHAHADEVTLCSNGFSQKMNIGLAIYNMRAAADYLLFALGTDKKESKDVGGAMSIMDKIKVPPKLGNIVESFLKNQSFVNAKEVIKVTDISKTSTTKKWIDPKKDPEKILPIIREILEEKGSINDHISGFVGWLAAETTRRLEGKADPIIVLELIRDVQLEELGGEEIETNHMQVILDGVPTNLCLNCGEPVDDCKCDVESILARHWGFSG